MWFKKKSIQQELNEIADKFKKRNPDVALIIYAMSLCVGCDKLLKNDSLERLSKMALSLTRENQIILDRNKK